MKEYCAVLKPLARGLDILQGEDDCYFGTILPVLTTIIKKVNALKPNLSSMTKGLVDFIENAVKHQFQGYFERYNSILAAVVLSKFKLMWVESKSKKDEYKQLLLQEMEKHADKEAIIAPAGSQKTSNSKDDFYEFTDESSSHNSCIEVEANEYLSNAKTIECLQKYPNH